MNSYSAPRVPPKLDKAARDPPDPPQPFPVPFRPPASACGARFFSFFPPPLRKNRQVCHGSHGSLTALWAVAVECPYASARAVPAARPLSARTPRDARTTRGWLRGLLLGRVRRKRRWRASRSSRCWASASAWCSKRRTKVGALLRLAADRCSLEYHSSSVHTAASCCAAAYSPRRARALQVSSRSEEAAEITVCSMWMTEAGRRTAHVQFVPHT